MVNENPLVAFLLYAFLVPLHAQADVNADAGLYDPLPPDGSAFVRFVNAFHDDDPDAAQANNKTFTELGYKEISSYYPVPEGTDVSVGIGDNATQASFEEGQFYTIVLTRNDELKVIEDPVNDNQAKAQIALYNFSERENVSVKTVNGGVEVVESVSPNGSAYRQINPVKVSLSVYSGENRMKDLDAVSLERSQAYAAVVYPDQQVDWVRSTTDTTK